MNLTLTLCANPDCRRLLVDVAKWCPTCSTYAVVKVPVEVSEQQIAPGKWVEMRPIRAGGA